MENTLIPPGTIVVGLDGSPSADRALDWAIDQAVREHRPLTLAHGLDPASSVWLDPTGGADYRALSEAQLQDREDMLSRARARIADRAPTVPVHEAVWASDPRVTLLDLSDEASLVVVGSRGRGPLRSMLLGSVSASVARHAACPVVVVRPGKAGVARNGVIVGADGSPESLTTVEFAYRQASLHDLPLTVLHCEWEWLPEETDDDARLRAVEPLSGLAEKFPDVRARLELGHGDAADQLARESQRMDLVVIGAQHGGRLTTFLHGSVTRTVIEHSDCPVAVVPVVRADHGPDHGADDEKIQV